MLNTSKARSFLLFLMASCITTLTGCTQYDILPLKEAFPTKSTAYIGAPPVTLLPVEDSSAAGSSYLGRGTLLISYLVIIPYQYMDRVISADVARTDVVRIATHAQLNNAGIAVIDQASGGINQFNTLSPGELGMFIRIRELKVDTNLSIAMPLVLFNFFIYEDNVSHVALDCQLWQAGSKMPLWEGAVDEHFDDSVEVKDAVARVVDQCISRSKLVDVRNELIARRNNDYAQLMLNAEKQQAAGDGASALDFFAQATVVALEASDSEKAFNAMAKQYQALAQKPALPEEARKFGVQAETAIRNKNLPGAVESFRNELRVTPWWPQSHYNLALILGELKRNPEAIEEMQKYLALVPAAVNARQAQDKIYVWEMHR